MSKTADYIPVSLFSIWQNPPVGKMEQILHFDWLPKHLARSRNPLLTKREVKMAEYWPRPFLHFIDLDE